MRKQSALKFVIDSTEIRQTGTKKLILSVSVRVKDGGVYQLALDGVEGSKHSSQNFIPPRATKEKTLRIDEALSEFP